MRERALLPLRSYRDFTKVTEAWLTSEVLVEELELRNLTEHTLSTAWDVWCEKQDLEEWVNEVVYFSNYTHARLMNESLTNLFNELDEILKRIQIPKERVLDIRIFFDNVAVDYDLPFQYELRNKKWRKLL